jgi:hypothetical protein
VLCADGTGLFGYKEGYTKWDEGLWQCFTMALDPAVMSEVTYSKSRIVSACVTITGLVFVAILIGV